MDLIILITIFLGYCGYAVLEGIREAWYFYMKHDAGGKIPTTMPQNEHPYFAAQRGFVIGMATIITVYNSGVVVGTSGSSVVLCGVLYLFSLCAMFPFLHDGAYYLKMDQINPGIYPKRWTAQSYKSNARINLDYADRLLLFVAGVLFSILASILAPIL
jgi:hypothetical protein